MAASGVTKVEISEPPTHVRASAEAAAFIAGAGPDELRLCLFSESLQSVSGSSAAGGSFMADIQPAYYRQDGRDEEKCFLVHISSQSSADGAPCGTSTTAHISLRLETLEQQHHEYLKLKGHSLDKKTHMRRRGDQMVISRVITEGQEVRHDTRSYELSELTGLVSEASNLLVLRLLARRKTPQSLDFLALDAEMNLCRSSYRALGCRPQLIGKETVEVYGIERAIRSDDVPITWQYCFLSDGHLSSRVQVGSPVTLTIPHMPVLSEPEEEDPKPVFEKKPLNWEEDGELYSRFLERKEDLMSEHQTYLRRHPELKALLGDFMQLLLLRKPEDVVTFAAEYFSPFSSARERSETFRSATSRSTLRDGGEE